MMHEKRSDALRRAIHATFPTLEIKAAVLALIDYSVLDDAGNLVVFGADNMANTLGMAMNKPEEGGAMLLHLLEVGALSAPQTNKGAALVWELATVRKGRRPPVEFLSHIQADQRALADFAWNHGYEAAAAEFADTTDARADADTADATKLQNIVRYNEEMDEMEFPPTGDDYSALLGLALGDSYTTPHRRGR